MKTRCSCICRSLRFSLASIAVSMPIGLQLAHSQTPKVEWKMHTINDQSPFEACGSADFNGDGKIDVFSGDSWYEAPTWKRHKVRDVEEAANGHYHNDFCDSPMDVNGDGRMDIVSCTYFSRRVSWLENPGGDATAPWTEHEIDLPGNMEAGELVLINGDRIPDFLPNPGNAVVWYELTKQQTQVIWTKHDLGSEGAGHGVGAGDINSDGRTDIITPKGWYEQPSDAASEKWTFHADFQLGATGIMIIGRDVDGDHLTDVIWGMGHDFGLYWLKQSKSSDGKREWTKLTIDDTFSQVHTLMMANVDGVGEPELITGKRVYAHEVEPGATDSSVVLSFQFDREAKQWNKQTIFRGVPAPNAPKSADERRALKDFPRGTAGTGLQISAVDMDQDGDIDLVCPGKSGLYWFENLLR